jgi:hypothetical protein
MTTEDRRSFGVSNLVWVLLFLVVLLVALARGLSLGYLLVWLVLSTGWIVYWWKSHRLR